jgi:hypothetical protein
MTQMMGRNGKREVTEKLSSGDKFERIELISGAIALFGRDVSQCAMRSYSSLMLADSMTFFHRAVSDAM